MPQNAEYERGFLAVSVMLGEPREAVEAVLVEGAWARILGPQGDSRDVRARVAARVVTQIMAEIERTVLA